MNVPNRLTIVRIFMIPLFMLVVLVPWSWGSANVAGPTFQCWKVL